MGSEDAAIGVAGAVPAADAANTGAGVSWKRLGLMLAVLLGLSGFTGLLLHEFMRQRPLDLRGVTTSLSGAFRESLARNHVPEDAIAGGTPTFQSFQEGGGWYSFDYHVQLPADLPLDSIVEHVGQDMSRRGLQLKPAEDVAEDHTLRFAVQGQPFLTAVFAQAQAAQPEDLRSASTRIASALYQYLSNRKLHIELERGPEEQRDEAARWTLSIFTVRAEALPEMNALQAELKSLLAPQGASALLGEGATGALRLDVRYQDRLVGQVDFLAEAPPAPSEGAPPEVELPHTPPDFIAPPMAEEAPAAETPAATAVAIQNPQLPPLEELPLESTVLEETQLEKPESGLPSGAVPAPAVSKKPQMAVIVDDGGYGGERTERLLELNPKLTLAILPNTPFAHATAQRAQEKGFELMLHMPMETYGGKAAAFPGEITTGMDEAEIQRLTVDAISQVPGIKGINNHTGSKFTRDAEKMNEFMKIVKENQYFFVDSITITKSAAYSVAQAMSVPSARRDIFIDNSSSPGLIREQFHALVARAKSHGTAIGIGHFRPNTVSVLEEELPKLEEYGVELVHVSELVH